MGVCAAVCLLKIRMVTGLLWQTLDLKYAFCSLESNLELHLAVDRLQVAKRGVEKKSSRSDILRIYALDLWLLVTYRLAGSKFHRYVLLFSTQLQYIKITLKRLMACELCN